MYMYIVLIRISSACAHVYIASAGTHTPHPTFRACYASIMLDDRRVLCWPSVPMPTLKIGVVVCKLGVTSYHTFQKFGYTVRGIPTKLTTPSGLGGCK